MSDVACVLPAGALLGEGPVWDVAERALYWVDIKRQEVHRFDPGTGRDARWSTPEPVGSLAVREAGGLVVALRAGFHFLDLASGALAPVALPEADRPGNRFNDGKCDRQGRFWAGSMHHRAEKPTGALYRLDPDLSVHRMVEGLICSNALCWSPDGRTMYHADTGRGTVWAWDSDGAGVIANRRVFVALDRSEGFPDGATVDAEGFLWLAHWDGGMVSRYDPAGRRERAIRVPVQRVTCPAFGGPELDVLYLTTAATGLPEAELARQPWAGAILALDPGVRGLPEARFRG